MSPSVVPELQHWQPWECVRNAVPGPGLKLLNQNLHFIKIPCDQYVGQGFGLDLYYYSSFQTNAVLFPHSVLHAPRRENVSLFKRHLVSTALTALNIYFKVNLKALPPT